MPSKTRPPSQHSRPSKGAQPPANSPSGGGGAAKGKKRVERYLEQHFSGAKKSWYEVIQDVSVSGTTTTLKTSLSDDRAGKSLAHDICWDLIGAIPGVTDIVRVTGRPGDRTLAKCVP